MTRAWTEISVLVPLGWLELVAESLALSPCTSVAFGRTSLGTPAPPEGYDYVRTYVTEQDDTPKLRKRVAKVLAELAGATEAEELAGLQLRFRRLPAEDYANSWRKSWKPMRVAGFAIVPRKWRGERKRGDVRLVLEPGGAFGTGRHATTRGCLRAISARLKAGERVLDAGCGSGILGVAAALRGARYVLGFDVDATAIPYALELARWNQVDHVCEFRVGGFECLDQESLPFDGVLANIYADLIAEHAGSLAGQLRRGGWFAFSGCAVLKRTATLAAIERAGLSVERLHTRGRWDTYVGRRN